LIGWYKLVEYIFDRLIESMRPMSSLAYLPLIIIWFGIEELRRVLLIIIACSLVCMVNVIAGTKNVPKVYVDAATTMGASYPTVSSCCRHDQAACGTSNRSTCRDLATPKCDCLMNCSQ